MNSINLPVWRLIFMSLLLLPLLACNNDDMNDDGGGDGTNNNDDFETILLIIDEESIDNGNEPNDFTENEVNDAVSEIGQREILKYFSENVNEEITLYTGQVGDEGWFALKQTPATWNSVGPTGNGARNYLQAGPGLGGNQNDDLLDEVPNVIPLRATSLAMLKGQKVIAVVYDSDISINYDPLTGNLQGENLGIVAFEVLEVNARTNGSSSDLPSVNIRILNAATVAETDLFLFGNPLIPESSSEPEDTTPPQSISEITLNPTQN